MADDYSADDLADVLRDNYEAALDDMPPSWHRDAVAQALGRVDWLEVAEALKGE